MITRGALRHGALAGGAGAIAAFGQAPYDLPFLMLAGLIAAVWLFKDRATPLQAAATGWAFGTGYFMHALQWIVSPFMVDPVRHGWMAPFALVLLAAGLALFWGLAFWLARRISRADLLPLALKRLPNRWWTPACRLCWQASVRMALICGCSP